LPKYKESQLPVFSTRRQSYGFRRHHKCCPLTVSTTMPQITFKTQPTTLQTSQHMAILYQATKMLNIFYNLWWEIQKLVNRSMLQHRI